MIRPQNDIPLPVLSQRILAHGDRGPVFVDNCEGTCSVEGDTLDELRRDAGFGEDSAAACGETGPDVRGGLFEDSVVGIVSVGDGVLCRRAITNIVAGARDYVPVWSARILPLRSSNAARAEPVPLKEQVRSGAITSGAKLTRQTRYRTLALPCFKNERSRYSEQ
jgi:hypothetical protein